MEVKPQKPKHINLTAKNLNLIKSFATPFSYSTSATLFYENQIPLVVYILIVPTRSLLGLTEIVRGIPSLYAAKIKEGSKVFFLDKSSIQELINHIEDVDGELEKFLLNLEAA
jgi:hypothetical protein